MKPSKQVWQVDVKYESYRAKLDTYLLSGANAAAVEKKALSLARQRDQDLVPGEPKHKPYIRSIELIGTLDD